MVVLIPSENLLEFGLVDAYRSFQENANRLLQTQGVSDSSPGPASFLVLRFVLAIWCGLVGMFFTWPGLRVARMHKDALDYAKDSKILT